MSVYKPKRSRFWAYDLVIAGTRLHGSTGQETRRGAEAFERRLRAQVAEGRVADAGDMTLVLAAERWFAERVEGRASANDVARRIGTLHKCIGARTLREITGDHVSIAIQKRRGMLHRGRIVSNATVNRDIIAPLRAILRRARRVWGARNMPEIAWDQLALPEAPEIVREYSDDHAARWVEECPGDVERLAARVLLRYGLRFGELWFPPTAVDAIARKLTIRHRKADEFSTLPLPLLDEDAIALGKLAADALAAGADDIWGLRYWQLHYRLRTAAARAGIEPGRVIHGMRHHAGTRIARAGGLHLAKRLLGHASIASTARYAHAQDDDLRAALAKDSRHGPGAAPEASKKTKRNQGDK